MNTFRNVVFVAAIAGLLAGLALAAMQSYATWPLIFQAETFEAAEPEAPHEHPAPAADAAQAAAPAAQAAHAHDHGEDEWEPADGFERSAYSVLASVLTGVGFALILIVVSEFAGGIQTWRQGALWGLGGFSAFVLAPQLGLPPELPAMPAADLFARQVWWWGAVLCTGVGLAMIVFGRSALLSIAGLAVIVAPHLIGAPQPVSYETAVPEGLHHQFVVNTTVVNLVFWVVLGGLIGVFRNRVFGSDVALESKLA